MNKIQIYLVPVLNTNKNIFGLTKGIIWIQIYFISQERSNMNIQREFTNANINICHTLVTGTVTVKVTVLMCWPGYKAPYYFFSISKFYLALLSQGFWWHLSIVSMNFIFIYNLYYVLGHVSPNQLLVSWKQKQYW